MKRKSSAQEIAKIVGVSASRGVEAVLKAQLISAIIKEIETQNITHAQLAKKAKIPRSAVTGIISGSLQKVTIDRILKLVDAVGLVPHVKLTKAA
jgi:predicted XRE-type DNA-binding protein